MATSLTGGMVRGGPDPRVVGGALLMTLGGSALLLQAAGPRMAALLLVGLLLGISLYHASFGFTYAWRRFLVEGEGRGLRAQMLMLAVAVLLFFPALDAGQLFGRPVGGFVAPVGVSLAVGAFLFGIGMQLGGGCASGTLFTVGGGSTRMVVTLAFFVLGSVIGTAHMPFWLAQPSLPPISLVRELGLVPALTLNLVLFGAIALLTLVVERRRGAPERLPRRRWDLLRGPWPILAGAVALALLNYATLALAGRPWGITWGFALWGAKLFDAIGIAVREWPYWAARAGALDAPVWRDVTSVMNVGIILGAFLAAGLAGAFRPVWRLPPRAVLSAAIGGLLLGYGARLAFGCNIGAFFSGIASGSLHGWAWMVFAFAGNWLGTYLRPLFGMSRG